MHGRRNGAIALMNTCTHAQYAHMYTCMHACTHAQNDMNTCTREICMHVHHAQNDMNACTHAHYAQVVTRKELTPSVTTTTIIPLHLILEKLVDRHRDVSKWGN